MSEVKEDAVKEEEKKESEEKKEGGGWSQAARKPQQPVEGKQGFLVARAKDASAVVKKHEAVEPPDDEVCATENIPDTKDVEYTLEDKILFYKERECLLLLLEARKALATMILRTEKQHASKHRERKLREEAEKKATGKLTVQEIQEMLQSSPDEDYYDIASEIQELKKQLVISVRQNHKLERDLAKLDKRIALLIKNRTSLQEVIAASKGMKSQKKMETTQMDAKKTEHYQDLFYLLQTEPKYLARCIYMISPAQLDSFLETVILTLFGDNFSPREEFLLLSLFKISIEKEISAIKNLSDFIGGQSESVLPKMINSYNKRKLGLDYLKSTLGELITSCTKTEINLELNPLLIYQAMINEQEIMTGERSNLDRNIAAEVAAENPNVKKIIEERLGKLENICQLLVDKIVKSLDNLPYGLRWLCKQLRDLCLKSLPNTTEEDISKVIAYFVYYRFINLAIVQPDAFKVIDSDLSMFARKTVIVLARVLQHLFNFHQFDGEKPGEKYFVPLNAFILKNQPVIQEYISSIVQVSDPEEHLQVNRYMELAQKAKPVIIISLHEIYRTHALLAENLNELVVEKDDPLNIVMTDLGAPPTEFNEEDQDREIQLTLTNRFKVDMDEDAAEHNRIFAETKELVIPILRLVPVQKSIHRLNLMDVLEAGIKHATETNNAQLKSQIKKILENLGKLESAELVTKEDNYESFVHDVALEVANRATIREQQRKEVQRLKGTLDELNQHQKYVEESIQSYNDYLQDCKEKQYSAIVAKKKRGKKKIEGYKIPPVKFTYKELSKKGVIIESEVPHLSRKKTTFIISSDTPGMFNVVAKIAGLTVDNMTLDLDDLLEKHANNVNKHELEQVTLDVNMTIHLINKSFLS